MKPAPRIIHYFTAVTDTEARHRASMDPTKLYNTELSFWQAARKGYLTWPDGGPELLVLNAEVYAIPRESWIARFASSQEAERVLLAAGFRPSGRLFRFLA
jgi:hypothetical protein